MSSIDAANCDATANMFGVEPPIPPPDYRSSAAATAGVAAENGMVQVPPPMPPVLNIALDNRNHQRPEPVECMGGGKRMAGFEVDFSPKFTDEYAKLDDVKGMYDLADHQSPSSPPVSTFNVGYAKKEEKKTKCSCVLPLIIFVLVLTNLASLGLGGFNLFHVLGGQQSTSVVAVEDTAVVRELRQQVEELQQQVEELQQSLGLVSMQVGLCCSSLSPPLVTTETRPRGETTPPPLTVTEATGGETTPPSNEPTTEQPLFSAQLSKNCTVTLRGDCNINRNLLFASNASGLSFGICLTELISVADTANSHVTDVFCAITERQLMPVMSTLVRTGPSQFSCGCNAFEIPNNLAPQLRPFKCEIYERRCSLS